MKSVAFTGHRPDKLYGYNKDDNFPILVKLKEVIIDSINNGTTTFMSGMAQGVDLWAAEIVADLRDRKYPHIKLIAAIPFVGQETKWPPSSRRYWEDIKQRCDEVRYVSEEGYTPWAL